jgi:hypothetical protein
MRSSFRHILGERVATEYAIPQERLASGIHQQYQVLARMHHAAS